MAATTSHEAVLRHTFWSTGYLDGFWMRSTLPSAMLQGVGHGRRGQNDALPVLLLQALVEHVHVQEPQEPAHARWQFCCWLRCFQRQ